MVDKSLTSKLEAVASGKTRPDSNMRVVHVVSGGPPTRRYESVCEISGNGRVSLQLKDETSFTGLRSFRTLLNSKEIVSLLREIVDAKLLDVEKTEAGFLPDSTVGMIVIRVSKTERRFVYLAEKEERKDQRILLPVPIARVHLALERVARRAVERDEETLSYVKKKAKNPTLKPSKSQAGKMTLGRRSLEKRKGKL